MQSYKKLENYPAEALKPKARFLQSDKFEERNDGRRLPGEHLEDLLESLENT
jgi:hypothetical protein